MSKREIIIPSIEEIIEINKELTHEKTILNKSILNNIFDKIKDVKRKYKNKKKIMVVICSILWYDIITLHPFLDGNKRTAVEAVKYFLKINKAEIKLPYNYMIYISLKIVNNDLSFNNLKRIINKNMVWENEKS